MPGAPKSWANRVRRGISDGSSLSKSHVGNAPRRVSWRVRTAAQILLVALFCAIWQFAPESSFLSTRLRFLDRFSISSPIDVGVEVYRLLTGAPDVPLVWPFFLVTLQSTLVGLVIGMVAGTLVGVLLSEFPTASAILLPFVTMINSTPRVALIPIIVLITGPSAQASVVMSVLVVFFLAFFNGYEGASSVSTAMLDNAVLLGARRHQLVTTLRLPQAIVWEFGVLPNAISFSLIVVVTTELLTGVPGIGQLILNATSQLNAALSLAEVVILSVLGWFLIFLAERTRRAWLKWETKR